MVKDDIGELYEVRMIIFSIRKGEERMCQFIGTKNSTEFLRKGRCMGWVDRMTPNSVLLMFDFHCSKAKYKII